MKAMILAAGHGLRMRPLTLTTPKALVQVHGVPMIEYHLRALQKIGVSEVVVNVHALADKIEQALGDGRQWGMKIHVSHEQDQLLGTGGGVAKVLPILGDEPFILVSSDIFTDYDFTQLPTQLSGLAHCVMVDNPEHNGGGDFHLTTKGQLSRDLSPKLTYANIALVSPQLFAHQGQVAFELRDVLFGAIDRGQVSGEYYQGCWQNVGTMQQLDALNQSTKIG